MIVATYSSEPKFSAAKQHPNAQRAQISGAWVDYTGTQPTPGELAAHLVPPKARPLLAIIADLNVLSAAKKNAIWTDITSGTPPKWSTDAGPNAPSLAISHLMATEAGLTAAGILASKIRGVAFYILDNPTYLVNPAFDASINVPGRT